MKVTLVTVTYGKRWHLLRRALTAAFTEGVAYAIVVNNASEDSVGEFAHHDFGNAVRVITLTSNTGSANGYKVGIDNALEDAADYLLLLDDDNLLEPGALAALYEAYTEKSQSTSRDSLAMLGFRPDHQADVAEGISTLRIAQHPDSFFGFHLADIPFKIWRRTPWARKIHSTKPIPEMVPYQVAPYSGLFFHHSLIERFGTPDPCLVLYADDTEFTYRITAEGGAIWLVTKAHITDMETSWNIRKRFNSSFTGWLCGEGERRAYYASRNQSYFESHCRRHNHLIRAINKSIYMLLLRSTASRLHRIERYHLLYQAIEDGEAARLGLNPEYPL